MRYLILSVLPRKWDHEVRFIEFMPFGDSSLWKEKIITSEESKRSSA